MNASWSVGNDSSGDVNWSDGEDGENSECEHAHDTVDELHLDDRPVSVSSCQVEVDEKERECTYSQLTGLRFFIIRCK